MKRADITLSSINDDVHDQLTGERLGFCKILAWAFKEKLSVVAKYDPPEDPVALSGGVEDYYYGVSPVLDAGKVSKLVSSLVLQKEADLSRYIHENGNWFSTHGDQKRFLEPLAAYIVVCMASHFGVRIEVGVAEYKQLKCQLREAGYSDPGIDVLMERDTSLKGHPYVKLRGCPPYALLKCLGRYKYIKVEVAPEVLESDLGNGATLWKMTSSSEGVSIEEVYKHVELVEGKVFYSGVLLRPTKLEFMEEPHENDKVFSLCIHFERSTFGTVCAMDKNLTEHPIFSPRIRMAIVEMLRYDDRQKNELREQLEHEVELRRAKGAKGSPELGDKESSKRMIAIVNDYLRNSLNVNQIGVSANIITREDVLLLGHRSSLNIDADKLYPGVNGNAEVADGKVSFYRQSVYEDYPSIRLDDDRIDFFGEIGRETYAEMKLDLSRQEWSCRGIMLSGSMPAVAACQSQVDAGACIQAYDEPFRRLHFNLLFEHDTNLSFHEVEKRSMEAAEAFETYCYKGVLVDCAKNRFTYCCRWLWNRVCDIVKHKDFIESIVAMLVFSVTVSATSFKQSVGVWDMFRELKWTEVVTLVLAVLIISYTLVRLLLALWGFARDSRKVWRIRIYSGMSYDDVNRRIAQAVHGKGGKSTSFHPVAYASLRMFVDYRIYKSFFNEDRRR